MPRRWSQSEPEQLPLLDRGAAKLAQVLAAIIAAGSRGMTRDELAADGVFPIQTICPLVLDLIRSRQVRESGERRLTRAGHSAAVLVAAGVAILPAQTGDLVRRQLPARPDRARARWEAAEREAEQRRRDAAAERLILAGRRAKKSDAEIRMDLAAEGLEWPH